MSAVAAPYRTEHRGPNGLIVSLAVVVLVALAIPAAKETVHSKLHDEASVIRQCASAPENLAQVWVNSSGERLNCLIDLGGGVVGDLVMQWCKRSKWVEITAYIIGDGSLSEAINTLRAKACQQVWP